MVTSQSIQLIVGLGNPGTDYEKTRHNAGVWFIDRLIGDHTRMLSLEKKLKSWIGRIDLFGQTYFVAIPSTFMNESGQAVGAISRFYKIPPQAIVVVHDDLDLPVGTVRLKLGGGHGGHNGLRDIIANLGSPNFYRIRIGIGRPVHSDDVVNFVLTRPSSKERQLIDESIDRTIEVLPDCLSGNWSKAMNELHT